jgi:hypothetical protein
LIFKSGKKLIQSIEENKICVDKHLNPSLDAQSSEIIVTNKIYSAIYIENISDKNWINGISKFRKNTLCSSTQLKLSIGDKLEFPSGTRAIINIKKIMIINILQWIEMS